MLSPTERFSNRVRDYVRARPSYPVEVIDLLVAECGLNAESVVVDVGCGTGIFTAQLLTTGARVIGIEPNEPMREAAKKELADESNLELVDAKGEDTKLLDASADLITAAQAFHWLEPSLARQEFCRILKPGGRVALVWNERGSSGSAFSVGYERILHAFVPEYEKVRHRNTSDSQLLEWFEHPSARLYVFNNDHMVDEETLIARAFSSSYMPARGSSDYPLVLDELQRLFAQTRSDGVVRFEYDTKVFLGQLG